MSTIDMMLDEENELTFQLNIEGSRPGTAKCRLVLEAKDMKLQFNATPTNNDEINVVLPPLNHVLKEGTYDMTLEVIVDDRYFEPLKVQGSFEKRLKVMAESVQNKPKQKVAPSASLVNVKRSSKSKKKVVEQRSRQPEKKKKESITDQEIYNIIKALTKGK